MKKLFLLGFILIGFQFMSAQEALNNYKYIIVPKHFDFQNQSNSHQINSLTEFLLNKKGFITVFDDAVYPDDLKSNRCLALKVNLIAKSNFTRTKIKVTFINCDNKVVYESEEGSSKYKDIKKSYHEAIRGAFKTFDAFKYSYYTPVDTSILVKPNLVIKKEPKIEIAKKPKIVVKKAQKKVKVKKQKSKKDKLKSADIKQNKIKKVTKKEVFSIEGSYKSNDVAYEIASFKNYYIFSKILEKGDVPIGFIYKTSQKESYLLKTNSGTFTAYFKDNGNFVVDEINNDGTIKSIVYKKDEN